MKFGTRDWSEESSQEEDKHESHHFTLWLWSFLTHHLCHETISQPTFTQQKSQRKWGCAMAMPPSKLLYLFFYVISFSSLSSVFHNQNNCFTFAQKMVTSLLVVTTSQTSVTLSPLPLPIPKSITGLILQCLVWPKHQQSYFWMYNTNNVTEEYEFQEMLN
jgi:hypothetical protein